MLDLFLPNVEVRSMVKRDLGIAENEKPKVPRKD